MSRWFDREGIKAQYNLTPQNLTQWEREKIIIREATRKILDNIK